MIENAKRTKKPIILHMGMFLEFMAHLMLFRSLEDLMIVLRRVLSVLMHKIYKNIEDDLLFLGGQKCKKKRMIGIKPQGGFLCQVVFIFRNNKIIV